MKAEQAADPYEAARTIVLNRLTTAPRTRAELHETLSTRGIPEDVAERVLDRMTEVNLIDDAAYARAWVTSRQAGRGLARRALRQELQRKGIDPQVAGEALEQVDEQDERAAAAELVRRKLRSVRGLDRQVQTRRLAGMLARKGYDASVAFAVVKEALAQDEEPPE